MAYARGTILTFATDAATEARYELACNETFQTKRAAISVRDGGGERSLQIAVENGRWLENGRENPAVRGALDIDLGWSPSTNTLPIRRFKLKAGQASGEFNAAWVRFPELALEPLPQEYFRISERMYRYSSPAAPLRLNWSWMNTASSWNTRDCGNGYKAKARVNVFLYRYESTL